MRELKEHVDAFIMLSSEEEQDKSVRAQLYRLIASFTQYVPADMHDEMDLVNQLYLDSLDLLDVILHINEQFFLDIRPEELQKMRTVGDVLHTVEQKMAK